MPGPKPSVSAPAAAAAPAVVPPKLRLPGDVAPARYEVTLTLDPAAPTFEGTVAVELDARKATRVVWMHAEEIEVLRATFSRGAAAANGAAPKSEAASGAAPKSEAARGEAAANGAAVEVVTGNAPFVGFVLPEEVAPGKPGVLRVAYRGKVDGERPQGVYAVSEGAGADDRYLYTLFEPLDARRAFPCFDEPEYKVPWKLSIRVRKGHRAFSNAAVAGESDEGGLRRVDFAETPPLPSYLVAFMVGPFDVVDAGTAGQGKVPLRFVVPRGRGAETRYAAQVTPRIVGALEGYFGMDYPYSKLDVAVVPRYEGTMEHPGIVALGQPLTLIRPEDESLFRKQRYVNIAAHELAHYWFGDYVTMRWWDDTWLNESFAQWMDAKITEAVEPSWGELRAARLRRAADAMDADRLATAKRMRQPVESTEDILNAFDGSLTYDKGASVITMLEHAVGEEKWRSAVRAYMGKLAWKTASAQDFLGVLGEAAGGEAAAAFETFLNQPGVPLVTVTPVCGEGAPRLRLAQERFLPLGGTAASGLWKVPVCARWGAGKESGRMCVFLGEEAREVALPGGSACPEWVVPNEEGAGYYVSKYSTEAIDRLRGKGKARLSAAERAAMMRDVGMLVSSGAVPLGKAMELLPDAVASGDKTALQAVWSIHENVRGADLPEPLFLKLQSFERRTFGPKARALGFLPRPGEGPDAVDLRWMLLAGAGLGGEDPEIVRAAKGLAFKWLDDPKALPPDAVRITLSVAARSNDTALFDRLAARAEAASDRSEQELLFWALGHVTEKALAEKVLAMVLAKKEDRRETMPALFSLLSGRRTRDLAYAWVKKSFADLLEMSTGFEKPFLFGLPQVWCDEAHRADAEAFFGPYARKVDGAERRLSNALESITLCAAAHRAALPSLEAFLKRY